LGKENDGGTGCEIGGLCRRLKRKNLQNQRREGGGGSPWKKEDGFRFRFFCIFSDVSKLPPLCLSYGPVFIGKMLHGSQDWSLNFFFFFVNLIFLNFFVFFWKWAISTSTQWRKSMILK
jgi:hypothetical protein